MSVWTVIRNSLIVASIPAQLWLSGNKLLALLSIGVIGAYLFFSEILWAHQVYRR